MMPAPQQHPAPTGQGQLQQLRPCRVEITMADRSTGVHEGLYADTCEARDRAQEYFPEAVRIVVRSLRAGGGR